MPKTTSGPQTASSVEPLPDYTDGFNEWWATLKIDRTVRVMVEGVALLSWATARAELQVAHERSERTQEQLLEHSEGYLLEIRELKQTVAELRAKVERRDKVIGKAWALVKCGAHPSREEAQVALDKALVAFESDQAQRGQAQ